MNEQDYFYLLRLCDAQMWQGCCCLRKRSYENDDSISEIRCAG